MRESIMFARAHSTDELDGQGEEGGCSCCGKWHNDVACVYGLELASYTDEQTGNTTLQIYIHDENCNDENYGGPEVLFVPNSVINADEDLYGAYVYADDEIDAHKLAELNALVQAAWDVLDARFI